MKKEEHPIMGGGGEHGQEKLEQTQAEPNHTTTEKHWKSWQRKASTRWFAQTDTKDQATRKEKGR